MAIWESSRWIVLIQPVIGFPPWVSESCTLYISIIKTNQLILTGNQNISYHVDSFDAEV